MQKKAKRKAHCLSVLSSSSPSGKEVKTGGFLFLAAAAAAAA